MKIEVKNIKTNMMFSEETICFKGDLYLDGKKVGHCENDGHGGCTNYYGIEKYHSEDIKRMEEYCKTLPKVKHGDMEWEQSLEGVIDGIIDDHVNDKEKKKFQKKMEKDMLTKLVLSKGNPNQYETVGWKGGVTIEKILNNPLWRSSFINTINKYKGEGYTILNTNIPQELL